MGGDARIVLPFVMIISSLMLSKIPFAKSPKISLKGSVKEKWGFYSALFMMALVFGSKGFLLFPLALIMILVSLIKWTKSHRDLEDAVEVD